MKKRIFSVLLFLVITIALAACGRTPSADDPGNQGGSDQIIDPQNDPLAFLEAAGKKLKNANSFQMQSYEWRMRTELYQPGQETKLLQMQYVSDLDGAPASYMELELGVFHRWWYFHKDVGYHGDFDNSGMHYSTKHIRDEAFRSDQHFWFLSSGLNARDDELFERFCKLNYEVSTEQDGSTTFLSEQLTLEQLRELMAIEYPLCLGNDDFVLYSGTTRITRVDSVQQSNTSQNKYTIAITVDKEGFLSKLQLNTEHFNSNEQYILCGIRSINFTQINEKTAIEESGYEDGFVCEKAHPRIYYHFGDCYTAEYSYDSVNNTYCVSGFHDRYETGMTSPPYATLNICYAVPAEIEGVSVDSVGLFHGVDIESLVIPKGVSISIYGEDGAAGGPIGTLYFEDNEKNVCAFAKANLHPNYYLTPTCYFAGEWEYVDGVPTPIGK